MSAKEETLFTTSFSISISAVSSKNVLLRTIEKRRSSADKCKASLFMTLGVPSCHYFFVIGIDQCPSARAPANRFLAP